MLSMQGRKYLMDLGTVFQNTELKYKWVKDEWGWYGRKKRRKSGRRVYKYEAGIQNEASVTQGCVYSKESAGLLLKGDTKKGPEN